MRRLPVRRMTRKLKNRRMMVVQYDDGSVLIHFKKLIREYNGKLTIARNTQGLSLEAMRELIPIFIEAVRFDDTEDVRMEKEADESAD